MKNTFYKNRESNISCIIICVFLFLITFIPSISYKIIPVLIVSIILPISILLIYFVVTKETSLSKIYLTDKGIEWKLFNKQLKFIRWEEIQIIEKLSGVSRAEMTQSLKVILKTRTESLYDNDSFRFNCSKKIKRTIIALCPIEELKKQLEEIKFVY